LGADNLSFLGFVPDMPSFYAACDLLVLPSRSEGCPNYLLEAVAMGKPVVASAIAPIIELVQVTENALLFELGDVNGLTAAVQELLAQPERLRALSQSALAHADQFSARTCAARIAAILRALVAEHAAKPGRSRAAGPPPRPPAFRSERAAAE
jgi:glycosyltransferase involved in cell wall biosynthesis